MGRAAAADDDPAAARPSAACAAGRRSCRTSETLAQLALVARHGPEWFRALGTPDHPGSTLVTLGGGVRHPGVYEIAAGTHLGALLDEAGDVTEPVRAVLVGGYHGGWVDGADARALPLDRSSRSGLARGRGHRRARAVGLPDRRGLPRRRLARRPERRAVRALPARPGRDRRRGLGRRGPGARDPATLRRLRRWGADGQRPRRVPPSRRRGPLPGQRAAASSRPSSSCTAASGPCEACARRPVLSVPASPLAVAA